MKYIFLLFIGWQLGLLLVTFFGFSSIPHLGDVHNEVFYPTSGTDYWIRWANWDGGHFRGIAEGALDLLKV